MRDLYEQALALWHDGQCAQSEALARRLVRVAPAFAPGLALLATFHLQHGQAGHARPLLEHALRLQPDLVEAWINLGNACLELDDIDAAVQAFENARRQGAEGVAYLLGHGLACLGKGGFAPARRLLVQAYALEPEAADVRLAYARCLVEFECFDDAAQVLAGLEAGHLGGQQRKALAWLQMQCGQDEVALALYTGLIGQMPEDAEPRIQLALLLERLNRVDEAAQVLAGLPPPASDDGRAMLALASARIARRSGQPRTAAALAQAALPAGADPAMRAQLWFEMAKDHDQEGDAAAAIHALEHAHAQARLAFQSRWPETALPAVLGWLDQRRRHAPAVAVDAGRRQGPPDPVFLVGFPRSGTTLLERMLDAHSALDVLDERPALEVMIENLRRRDGWRDAALDASLDGLPGAAVDQARADYWQQVHRHLVPQGRLVDKYPLTMTRLPYVARLFPQADWLLLLRHPCDCVLSCHMQAFGLNGGALAFESLASTAHTYVRVMEWWHAQRERVPARVHVLRYEDLVQAPAQRLEALMGFLSLPMQAAQLQSHHAAAQRSRRINTPSYSQVIEPVNANAVGRWKRYRAFFGDVVLAELEPWARRFGYTME